MTGQRLRRSRADRRFLCAALPLAFVVAGHGARAADDLVYGPAPAWVSPTRSVGPAPAADDQPVRILLQDNQVRFGPDGDETYSETLMRAQTAQGLQVLGSLSRGWDPQTDVLTIHTLRILRGDQVIDVLAEGKRFTVIRREQNLEQAMIDGRLTATLQLEDLRAGDIVDFAATVRHHDPSFPARSEQLFGVNNGVVIDHLHFRGLWPRTMSVGWKVTEGLNAPKVTDLGADREAVIDLKGAKAARPPKLAPARFGEIAQLQFSAYESWPQASAALAPLFAKASTLDAKSPLHAELARIRATAQAPEARAAAALRLVEEQVRYVFLGADLGGYRPAPSDLTWTRRFGDCKGKTVLLVALLRELGLDATPVLVSTLHGDGLDDRLPSLGLFNHAIVRLRLSGKTYWLDATRTGDRALGRLTAPPYRWALPLTQSGSTLDRIEQTPLDQPSITYVLRIDASQGLTAPAPTHGEVTLRGDGALGIGQMVRSATKADIDKASRQFWTTQAGWITIKSLATTFDESLGEAKLTVDGLGQLDWRDSDSGLGRRFELVAAALGGSVDLKREPDTRQDAPYTVAFPAFSTAEETLVLPDHGVGFNLEGRDIDREIGGVRYQRKSTSAEGSVVTRTSILALRPEFPASEALTVQLGISNLAGEGEWVRAPVAYGLKSGELDGRSALDPTTTEAYFNRAAEMLGKGETDKAIADFSEVIRREPAMAQAHLGRGLALQRKGRMEAALADFDNAVKALPDNLAARFARADARLLAHDVDAALSDSAEAIRLAPNTIEPYNRRGDLYLRLKRPKDALADFEASLKINPQGYAALEGRARAEVALGHPDQAEADLARIGESADVLNWRCFARAVANITLETALKECDAAIRLAPAAAQILDSRGLVYYRLGDFPKAAADLKRALELNPKSPESRFVLGLARRRMGEVAESEADFAAARALDAHIDQTYADYGLAP